MAFSSAAVRSTELSAATRFVAVGALHPVYRPNGGFLTPEQWAGALEAAGFADVRCLPDLPRLRERFPMFYVAAIGATRPA